jgi:IS30 family transposase
VNCRLSRVAIAHLLLPVWHYQGVRETGGIPLLISHETIYRRIRWDKRIGGDLWRHTRIMSKFGRKRYRSIDSRGVLPGKRHISERPPEVALRTVFGHWEGDTVIGQDKHHGILTLVERMTGFTTLKKLSDRNTSEVNRAATRAIRRHCRRFRTLAGGGPRWLG